MEEKLNFIEWVAEHEEMGKGESAKFIASIFEWIETDGGVHKGDCTKEPQPCGLCVLESLLSDYREYRFNAPCP